MFSSQVLLLSRSFKIWNKFEITNFLHNFSNTPWLCGVVVITTAQLHSSKPELRFCAGSNFVGGVSEIRDGEDL